MSVRNPKGPIVDGFFFFCRNCVQAFPDWRQREAIVTELVHSVVRAGSNLLGPGQSLAWRDLGLAPPGTPFSSSASAYSVDVLDDDDDDDASSRDVQARTTATALLTGLEENAFLLANTIGRQKLVFQAFDNIREPLSLWFFQSFLFFFSF